MDETFVKIHLWIITGLVGIVGFFIRHWMLKVESQAVELTKEQEKMEEEIKANKEELIKKADAMFAKAVEKFSDAADRLDRTVAGLETIVQVIKQQNVEFSRRMEEKEKWLDQHDESIKEITQRLSVVETRCKISHGH